MVGVSGDEVAGLALFKKVHNLNFPLLSDHTGSLAKKFGVPTRKGGQISQKIDGKTFDLKRGVTIPRHTFVINKEGKIAAAYAVENAAGDSKKILGLLKDLK